MFAKPSNYYAAGARVFAVLAIVFFVLALALNVARIGPSAACPPEGYSAPAPNDAEKEQDDRGVLRIVNVLTGGHEVAIGQPLCVIVAGVAPVSSLLEDRDSARRKRDDAQSLDEKAHRDSDAAAQEAAKLQATADASKRGAKPTADADQQAATSAQALAAAELLAKKQADEELAEAQRKYDAAIAAIGNRKAVELTPFLDGKRAPQATTNVLPIPASQPVPFDFGTPTDASTPVADFWRNALAGTQNGAHSFSLGLARGNFEVAETTKNPLVTFRVYDRLTFWAGTAFAVSLIACIVLLASQTTLLRANNSRFSLSDLGDDEKYKVGRPSGPWSLGRAQMALWMVIVVVGFLFFWIALGEYQGVINSSILILLGLNATTGLLAMQLDFEKTSGATTSSTFYMDWISDGDGPQLQRIQVILWTVVLAFVFLYNVAYKFTFPVFDTNLLLLMGIAQAAYIGFKPGESPKGLQPKTIDPQTAVAGERKSYTIKGANLAAATRAEFALGNVTAPASVLASHDEQIQLTAKLENPGDWTPRIASGSDEPIKVPQTVKVVAAPQIAPLTAIADKSTSFTIKGANLTGATKVDFVFGGTTIPIDKSKFVASADDQIALPGDTALPRGEWAVRITLASGESVDAQQTVKVDPPPSPTP